jgi:glucokinase
MMSSRDKVVVLAGDVGGAKTMLGLLTMRTVRPEVLEAETYSSNKALGLFASILGAAAGDLALTGMATGGVYLGGGIPAKILPKLKESGFLKAFTNKGRFGDLLANVPVRVILNEKTNLLEAAHCALETALGTVFSGGGKTRRVFELRAPMNKLREVDPTGFGRPSTGRAPEEKVRT